MPFKDHYRTLGVPPSADFQEIRKAPFRNPDFNVLSMGMSGDFEVAIEEGANVVRVGSALFGE